MAIIPSKVTGFEEYEEFYYLQVAINDMLDQIHSYHDNVLEQNISLKQQRLKLYSHSLIRILFLMF